MSDKFNLIINGEVIAVTPEYTMTHDDLIAHKPEYTHTFKIKTGKHNLNIL